MPVTKRALGPSSCSASRGDGPTAIAVSGIARTLKFLTWRGRSDACVSFPLISLQDRRSTTTERASDSGRDLCSGVIDRFYRGRVLGGARIGSYDDSMSVGWPTGMIATATPGRPNWSSRSHNRPVLTEKETFAPPYSTRDHDRQRGADRCIGTNNPERWNAACS